MSIELADRVLAGSGRDNSLDVLIEIALFKPDWRYASVRANAAGTKVIYTTPEGKKFTYWAEEWAGNRIRAVFELRAHPTTRP